MRTTRTALFMLTLIVAFGGLIAQDTAFPGGRIAISSDGNYHDRDDIAATPMSLALLAKAGLQEQLVYYGHSDHIWDTDREQEKEMIISAEESARLFGFNPELIHNAKKETTATIMELVKVINASSINNVLWIIGAGPMEVIGKAIQYSDKKARPYVTVISHSMWNNQHASKHHGGYSFESLASLGVSIIEITNQNPDTNKPYEEYFWLRDSDDPKMKWLWERGVAAGKKNFDPSDAGMVYWLLTGGPSGGDDHPNPEKLRNFFLMD